jgi:hypothetical protein
MKSKHPKASSASAFFTSNSVQLSKLARNTLLGLSSFVLIACGGGGGGSAESSSAPNVPSSPSAPVSDFQPSSELLLQDAESSNELYIEKDFLFDQTLITQLTINLLNSEGSELTYKRLNIYSLNTEELDTIPSEWTDELLENTQLIALGISDGTGTFSRAIELPNTGQDQHLLLVEVNAVGFENKVLVPVTGETTTITLGAS